MQEVILVKLGEIVLKGLNRRVFEDRLLKNIRRRIQRAGNFDVYSMQSTIYIVPKDADADIDEAEERVAKVFGVIGYIDDYVKVKKHQNTGLTAPQKFLLQLAAAIVFTVLMRNHHYLTPDLYIPFVNVTLSLPWPVYMVFAAFVMVGTVNAVNLTDGVDGLATGVTIPVMLFYVAVSAWYGRSDLITAAAAMAGGLSAFLIYNFHPAKVFLSLIHISEPTRPY